MTFNVYEGYGNTNGELLVKEYRGLIATTKYIVRGSSRRLSLSKSKTLPALI